MNTITMQRASTLTETECRARRHAVYALLREIGQRARAEQQKASGEVSLGGVSPLAQSDAQSNALDAHGRVYHETG